MELSPRLSLAYLAPSQAQKHVTVNETFRRLDQLVQQGVLSRSTSAEPSSPSEGDAYILPASPTGTNWAAFDEHDIVAFQDGAWTRIAPKEGWLCWIADDDQLAVFDGAAWTVIVSGASVSSVFGRTGDVVAAASDYDAAEIDFTPAGGIAATDVQAAIEELDADKLSNLSVDEHLIQNTGASGTGVRGMIRFYSKDSAETLDEMAQIDFYVSDKTAGSEDALLRFNTMNAGSILTQLAFGAGVVVGFPTGLEKGYGTINAQAVYDDNVLLTCYVFDQLLDGAVSFEKWDAKVPDRIVPEQRDKAGNVVRDAETIARRHEPARKFITRVGTEFDPLTLDGYAKHWKEKRHLTSMPNEATFDPGQGMAAGEWIQRLVETVEIQAVLIEALNERVKALEAT
jgi:hypothetical protein